MTITNSAAKAAIKREICLLGQPPLTKHLDFIKNRIASPKAMDPRSATNAWRKANDYYAALEQTEAGFADLAQCLPLTASQQKLTSAVRGDVRFRKTFTTMPTDICMVELEKLVIFQTRVDADYLDILAARLKPRPAFKGLIKFCFPLSVSEVPVEVQQVGARRIVFSAASTDFRFQSPVVVDQAQLRNVETAGPIVSMAGVPIGFGSNLFSVIRSGTRMLLHNGYHRACALYAAGFTHAPCIVQTVTRQEEFEVAAKAEVAQHTEFYFRSVRPPLLKDFFDPNIRRVFNVQRMKRVIEVNFDIREFYVPA